MKIKSVLIAGMIIAAFSFVLSSCNDDDNDSGTADVKISMANSLPSNRAYSEVNIDLQQISINVSADTLVSGGWYDLETNQGIYDLMDFATGNDTILAFDSVLVVQTIHQIRLILGDNNTVLENGSTYDLNTPSGQSSGIKIPVNVTLKPGFHYMVKLDFNPDESIVKTGNGKYNLHPVIDATVIEY